MKKIFYIVTFLILVFLGKEIYYYDSLENALNQKEIEIKFVISDGENAEQIGSNLKDHGLISSVWVFRRYLVEAELDRRVKSGVHVLSPSMTIPQIANDLTKSESGQIVVRILEGWTVKKIDKYLSSTVDLLAPGEFDDCAKNCKFDFEFLEDKPSSMSLEGYVFPDTYFFDPRGITARDVVNKMLLNFDRKFTRKMREDSKLVSNSWHKVVTMASLIEKETRVQDERAVVSGVLWKRVAEGIQLGVDAAVRYALDKWSEPLYKSDLRIDSPYNTYKKYGLPPGPISGFSEASLKAAVYPKSSEYYYYLHDRTGQVHFSKTLDEHNESVWKYLR